MMSRASFLCLLKFMRFGPHDQVGKNRPSVRSILASYLYRGQGVTDDHWGAAPTAHRPRLPNTAYTCPYKVACQAPQAIPYAHIWWPVWSPLQVLTIWRTSIVTLASNHQNKNKQIPWIQISRTKYVYTIKNVHPYSGLEHFFGEVYGQYIKMDCAFIS